MTQVRYDHWRAGTLGFPQLLRQQLDQVQPRTVCEIGGGANPSLSLDEVRQRGIEYTTLDISQAELDKAPAGYKKVLMDIAQPDLHVESRYDFMFSHWVAEHISDPRQFHQNVFDMLNPGGVAVHLMPTLYEPGFLGNKLMPEKLAAWVLRKVMPDRKLDSTEMKFPAYYRWCRGPSRRNLDRFRSVGFEVREAVGFFGTSYFGQGVLGRAYEAVARLLIRHPVPAFTSFLWLVVQKPAAEAVPGSSGESAAVAVGNA